MKIEKISTLVLWGLVGISVLCFIIFFAAGNTDEFIGKEPIPAAIDVVMWLMYGIFIVGAVGIVAMAGMSGAATLNNKKNGVVANNSGVPGFAIAVSVVGILIVSMILGWVFGLGATEVYDINDSEKLLATAFEAHYVEMFCWSIGILFVCSIVAVAVSMSGVLSLSSKKK